MPVPSAWGDISDVPSSNSPASSETVGPNMNAYLQAAFAYCKQLYEGQQNPTAAVPMNNQKLTGLAPGTVGTDGVNLNQLNTYCAIAGGWNVTGSVGFLNTVTCYSAVAFQANLTINSAGTLSTNNPASTANTFQANAATGPHLHLLNLSDGGRKYVRVSSNQFQIVNANYNGVPLILDDAGNLIVTGNMTAFSDERLKSDWVAPDKDFVSRLAAVQAGSYTRRDSGERQAGVSAQGIQKFLPEAVTEGYDGSLGLAYGQAAMVACVALAREVEALKARLAELEPS